MRWPGTGATRLPVSLGGLVVALALALVVFGPGRCAPLSSTPGTVDAGPRVERATFTCRRCGKPHPLGEPGFNWPDAVFALDLPEEERARIQAAGDNEDVATVQGRPYVRGWAPIPVHGQAQPLGLGFWVQLSPEDFQAFQAHRGEEHPPYAGRIANQSFYVEPTLGLPAHLVWRGPGLRPQLLLDEPEGHALARAQRDGIDAALAQAWREELAHKDEPEPARTPYAAALDVHGWELVFPEAAGKTTYVFSTPPAVGDFVKVLVAFRAADAKGDAVMLTAGWWLQVEDASGATWSGVLDNYPKVPSTLVRGSRVWFSPKHVLDWHAKAATP
jgi:hypothetical protein